MDQESMDEFFRMVGFDPEKQGSDDARAQSRGQHDQRATSPSGEGDPRATRSRQTRGQDAQGDQGEMSWGQILSSMFGFGGSNPFGDGQSPFDRGRRTTQSGDGDSGDSRGGRPRFVVDDDKNPFAKWSKRALAIGIVVFVLFLAFCYWWFHPPINIHSTDFWFILFILVLIPSFVTFRTLSWRATKTTGKREASAGRAKRFKWASYIPVALMVFFVVGTFAMWSFWPGNAHRYATILEVENSDFATDIQEVDYNSIPVIDRSSAVILGNRTLGEIPDYVSQFEISTVYSQINYQGRPVRVSPLNYADVFKWFTNMDTGVPAYVLVDMASQDTKIVRLDKPMHYVESDLLNRNIDRYVQLKFPTYYFDEKAFEIDEDGTPWWVCPVQTRTIGLFGGETIVRVVLVNACTGECQDYAIEDCPQWVDRAYPSDLLVQQYNWRGRFTNGWLNSWIGQQGVVQTTPGTDGQLGYNYIAKDDDVWVYTGVTSATADNAIVGFVLANQRTGDAHYYSVAGATEDSAMRSAEGQVQNLRYEATFPLLLNINGQPTYFMALKDSAGLAKKFAMLDIQRYQNVAVGDTVSECQKSYKALLVTNGAIDTSVSEDALKTATGVIDVMTEAVVDGNSHFYIKLEGTDAIFDFALPNQIEVVGFKEGDVVTITYVESEPTSAAQSIAAGKEPADAVVSGDAAGGDGEVVPIEETDLSTIPTSDEPSAGGAVSGAGEPVTEDGGPGEA